MYTALYVFAESLCILMNTCLYTAHAAANVYTFRYFLAIACYIYKYTSPVALFGSTLVQYFNLVTIHLEYPLPRAVLEI